MGFFFRLFGRRKPLVLLAAGDLILVMFPNERKAGEFRTLFAAVSKVSKKRNIFVEFVSKDKGGDLQVGLHGTVRALKSGKLIEFPTTLLHRKEQTFIFSPPLEVDETTIPLNRKEIAYTPSHVITYRARSSPYAQRGTLSEFSWEKLDFISNLPIPAGTPLKVALEIPYRANPMEILGRVFSCNAIPNEARKHRVCLTLEGLSANHLDDLFNYFALTKQSWKKIGTRPISA